jgi:phosphatidylserine/phosphatidylglycerophosphate/cardiolipin synthase-like enzyme
VSDIHEPLIDDRDWWAEGDTPVREHSRVTYLVDGRNAMLSICRHFLAAGKYIYLANWGLSPDLQLVRGKDHRAGPDGSPEQEALLQELRAEGLGEPEIAFWTSQELTVQNVLGYAVRKGVEVKVLLWDCSTLFSHYKPGSARDQLVSVGVTCLLDDSSRGLLHHPIESLHQKVTVVDGTHAFVGGIDPLIELSGDFDRWDVPFHHYSSELRRNTTNPLPHSWHDAHAIIEGTAVGDVELNFRQRWNDLVQRHHWDHSLIIPTHPLPEPVESHGLVQVARTIPEHTYNFDPDPGLQGIAQLYAKAFANAQHFIYLENQYFWLHAFYGLDIPFVGQDSPDMEHNIRELGKALQRGAALSFVLPDHPNVGRAFTDAGLERLRQEAPQAAEEGRIQVFCLGTSRNIDGEEHYRPVYVHAKTAVIDDTWSTVGSGNLNNRGMRDDTEMNVATLDPTLSRGLRLMLIAEHLGLLNDEELLIVSRHLGNQRQRPDTEQRARDIWDSLQRQLRNPLVALGMMIERAQENLRRYKEKQPLVGHLLPYLSAAEARREQLNFQEEIGWLETPNIRK